MPTIQEILSTDTPNEGRIIINNNFSNFYTEFSSHTSEVNPHETSASDIPYTKLQGTSYENIDTVAEALDYSTYQIYSHLSDYANPHQVALNQLTLSSTDLTTGNTIDLVTEVDNALNAFKFLYNKTQALLNAATITIEEISGLAAENIQDALEEIASDYAKKSRNETISGDWTISGNWTFTDNVGANVTAESIRINDSLIFGSLAEGSTNYFELSPTFVSANAQTVDLRSINDFYVSAGSIFTLDSDYQTVLNLSNTTATFTGPTTIDFHGDTEIIIGSGIESGQYKTLTLSGYKIVVDTNHTEFNFPPKANYTATDQQAASPNEFVTRNYVDQFIYEKDAFSSESPLLQNVTNLRDAINVLASQMSTNLKADYSYPLAPIGTELELEATGEVEGQGEEIYITLPVTVYPLNEIYITSISYYLPVGVDLIIDVVGSPGTDYTINSTEAFTDVVSLTETNYYNTQVSKILLIPGEPTQQTRLVRIKLKNTTNEIIKIKSKHTVGFGLLSENPDYLTPITTTTTTTTTTTSTTTTTTAP